jgi:YidC/Oxa1 family membrane protein insertase
LKEVSLKNNKTLFMVRLYEILAYEPIYNTLVLFYNIVPFKDFGVAIVLTTILVRFLLYPLYQKQISSQKKLQDLQPKIKEAQKKHKNNKEEQARIMMSLYKENGVNPVSGCLPAILLFIVFFAIYRAIINIAGAGLTVHQESLYSFVQNPGPINHLFLGFLDITLPNIALAIITAGAVYLQMKMMLGKAAAAPVEIAEGAGPDMATIMNKQMIFIAPAVSLFVGVTFPAALSLYWLTSTVFMIIQQKITLKHNAE